ncbi:MAG: immunoglobulin-like domain-containing protein [Bacteroidia bacterium]
MKKNLLLLFTLIVYGAIFSEYLKAQTPTFFTSDVNAPGNTYPFNQASGLAMQSLVAPGELTGAYLGRITKLYFQGTPSLSLTFSSLTISLTQTTLVGLPSNAMTGLTTVYTATSVVTSSNSSGWLMVTLPTPYVYDPTQSLVIEVLNCGSTGGFNITNATKSTMRRSYSTPGTCSMTYSGQGQQLFNFGVDMITGTSSGPILPPIANFYAPDTVWINSPATLINTSSFQSRVFWDFPGENPLQTGYYRQAGFIDTAKYYNNITYTFTSPGLKLVKLLAVNNFKRDSLRDSIYKYIYVDTPSQAPRADFITFKRIMGITEEAPFIDLTANGPTQWDWTIDPPCISCITDPANGIANYFITGTGQLGYNVASPRLAAFDPGQFKVCLRVWNLRGTDSICKSQYIKVVEGNYMCSGSGGFTSVNEEGFVYGISGPYQTYARSSWPSNCPGFTIAPCADSITLYVERIKMWPTDSIVIYNGPSTTSPRITAIGASAGGQIPLTTAQSIIKGGNAITLKYKPGAGALPPNYDSASFIIRWKATPASYPKPVSRIEISDTVYSNQLVSYKNKSTGKLMKYSWDTDGNGIFDSTTSSPTRTYLITVPTLKNICLVTYNCVGSDTSCKQVAFLPVNRPPIARFTADKFLGFNTDTFTMIDQTANGVAGWRWTFIPGAVQYLNGTTQTSQNPQVRLTSPVPYTVRLTTTNAFGIDSITKAAFINVSAYQTPGTGTTFSTIADATMGIRRVRLAGIDSTFTVATAPSYQYINNTTQVGTMYRGGKYAIVLDRPSAGSPLDHKIWIDKNYNANFENSELILNKINNGDAQLTDTIIIPANQAYGNTRMRVGLDLANSTQFNSVYSVIGMFKDFNVSIKKDEVKPVVVLNGTAILRTEINKLFVDPSVTAIDNIEGDISSRVQTISTLDTANIGVYNIKYFVTDYSGNTSDTLYRTVIVELNSTGPVLVLATPLLFTMEVGTEYVEPGFTALENNGNNINPNVIITTNLNKNKVGNYTMNYSITDAFNFNKTAVRQIRVRDTTKPNFVKKFIGATYKHQIGTAFNPLAIVTATDNYDRSLSVIFSSGVNQNIFGKYFVVYNVTDSSGNSASSYTVPVEVSDYIKPSITLIGELTTEVEVFTNFTIPGVSATDNYCATNTLVIVRTPSSLRNDTLGIFPVKFVVTDCVGNKDSIVRFIKVSKRSLPVITLLGANPLNLPRFKEFQEPGFNVQDNYYTNLNAQVIVDQSNLRNDIPGIYSVSYVVTDPSGNRSVVVTRKVNVTNSSEGVTENLFENYFSMYPSPSKGMLNIDMKSEIEFTSIDIYNVTGQLVAKFDSQLQSKNIFDLSNQSNGFYFVRINSAKGVFSKSFVISK